MTFHDTGDRLVPLQSGSNSLISPHMSCHVITIMRRRHHHQAPRIISIFTTIFPLAANHGPEVHLSVFSGKTLIDLSTRSTRS